MTGDINNEKWIKKPVLDFFSVKGVVQNLLELLGLENRVQFRPCNDKAFLHPGKSAKLVMLGKQPLEVGFFGEVHPILKDKEKFQQNLNEYTEHMENIKAINERYADDEDKRKSALFLLNQNRKQSSGFKGDDEENPNGFVGENLNCFLKKIVVEIKRKICEWQCPEKYAIFAM